MRAAWYEHKGPAREVIRVGELPDPEPAAGQVRVRVRVSAVNPSDTKNRIGWGYYKAMDYLRVIPGQDGAGVIDRIGAGVSEKRLGERVWIYEAQRGQAFGTAAEYCVVPAEKAVKLPDQASFEIGACLGIPAMTAHRCLFADGGVHGQTILVHGGAGAVGLAAVLLGKWAGARIFATVSRAEQQEIALAAGADEVINYKKEDVAGRARELTSDAGVDRAIDVAFDTNLDTNRAALKNNGVISTYATSGEFGRETEIPVSLMLVQGITVHFVLVYTMPQDAHQIAARDINACIESGWYRPIIGQRFALAELADAHKEQESGQVVGKILVMIDGN